MPIEIDYLTTEIIPAESTADPITGAVEGVYSLNEVHAAEAISHLIQFFRDGPRNQAVLSAVMTQVQELEQALWDTFHAFNVDDAEGDQLDLLGGLVGEGRSDRIDDNYRVAIRVRILVNRSDGRTEDLIAICRGIDPTATITFSDPGTMAIYISMSSLGGLTLSEAYALLRAAKTAGVRLHLSEAVSIWGSSTGTPAGDVWGSSTGTPAGADWSAAT